MEEPLIRGHVLEHTVRFYRTSFDYSAAAHVDGELSIEVKTALDTLTPAEWYPRRFQVEMLNAFATVRGNGDSTYGDILRCGTALADPSNDFVRLLMKLMTPDLFVKKLPRFWSRDHKASGAVEVEALEGARGARVRLRGIKHYDHAAVLWMGFIQGVLKQIGASGVIVRQEGWSWARPGPQDVSYEVRWS
jgi:hypothetical protein